MRQDVLCKESQVPRYGVSVESQGSQGLSYTQFTVCDVPQLVRLGSDERQKGVSLLCDLHLHRCSTPGMPCSALGPGAKPGNNRARKK